MACYSALGYHFGLDSGLDQTLLHLFEGLRSADPPPTCDADRLTPPSTRSIADAARLLLATVTERAAAAATGTLLLGGGCVSRPDGGSLIVCGPPNSGRTIVTARAAVRGFAYSADTLVSIHPETMRITPYRPPLRIRPELQPIAPEWMPRDETAGKGSGQDWLIPPDLLATPPAAQPLFPDLVVFPELRLGSPTLLTPLTEAESAHRLGAASIALGMVEDPADALCRLARRAPGYDLQIGSIEEAVTHMVSVWTSHA